MDSYLWRYRQQQQQQQQSEHQAPGLALLAPEPSSSSSSSTSINKAAVAGQTPFFTLPSVGYFTLAQWQELELQALIYKYMLAGVSVPVELILPIRRSLLSASPYFHYPELLYHHLQPSLLQTSYWGKCGIDPEPGRCRRTDGKKWRCAREVVVGQKYCERHVHRGRNRSRKHVEAPTPSSISLKTGLSSPSVWLAQEKHLDLPRPLVATPNALSLDQRQSGIQTVEKNLQGNCPNFYLVDLPDNKPEGYVLQRFLDEWPKSQREKNDSIDYAIHPASTTHLSISVPGNHSSDFSLKLSTGNPEKPRENNNNGLEMQQLSQPSNKGSGWVSHGEATMGGPLAEALRSSTSTRSPTSVLHKPNGSIYEISSISP